MSVTPIAVDVYHDVPLVEEILDEAEHYLGLGILHSTSCVCWGPCLYHDGRHCNWSVDTAALQMCECFNHVRHSLWTVNVGEDGVLVRAHTQNSVTDLSVDSRGYVHTHDPFTIPSPYCSEYVFQMLSLFFD
jgi:hypothetical protein